MYVSVTCLSKTPQNFLKRQKNNVLHMLVISIRNVQNTQGLYSLDQPVLSKRWKVGVCIRKQNKMYRLFRDRRSLTHIILYWLNALLAPNRRYVTYPPHSLNLTLTALIYHRKCECKTFNTLSKESALGMIIWMFDLPGGMGNSRE